MTASDLAFWLSAGLCVGGALLVVGGRRSPVVNATGLVVSMTGVAGACAIAGAPMIGLLQLIVSGGVAMVLVLVTLALVGTGRAQLTPLGVGAGVLRAGVGVLSVALIGLLMVHVVPAVPEGLALGDGGTSIRALGRGLFGQDVIAVTAAGFLLLVAIIGSVALVARSPD